MIKQPARNILVPLVEGGSDRSKMLGDLDQSSPDDKKLDDQQPFDRAHRNALLIPVSRGFIKEFPAGCPECKSQFVQHWLGQRGLPGFYALQRGVAAADQIS